MRKRIPIKNYQHEIQLVTNRAITAFVIMTILILLLIIRLGYLQLNKHTLYTTLSKKNWLDLVPVEPTRGLIYDRNGVLLAENIPVFSLDIIPDKIENMAQTLSEISKILPLTDLEIAQFQKQLKQHRRFDEIPLKLKLTEDEVAKFSEHQYHFKGALIKARLMRYYPLGPSFIHVLGYVGRINAQELNQIDTSNYSASNYIGKLGIEKYYEDELHGKVGYQQVESDASGEPVRVVNQIKTIPGKNLYLTLDSKLQLAVEQAMEGHRGAVVVIQPSTGQILAMVSQPTYDPNLFVAGVSNQDFKALQESPDRPLYNRAIRGLYPLGSTIKPFVAIEGLEIGAINAQTTIYDPGWFQLKNSEHIFRDMKKRGHGSVNLAKAIIVSCDTFFYELASKIGIQRLDEILTDFGFGKLTGVDLKEELAGNVASPAWKRRVKGVGWYPGDTIISGIGQGSMLATPLQLASGVATLSTRGQHYTPYLLYAKQAPGKKPIIRTPESLKKIKLTDKNNWNLVIHAMENVINTPEGTAYTRFGKNFPYTVAGKTGTAQLIKRKHVANEKDHEDQSHLSEKLRDNTLFIAFAPTDKPKIALAVIVENNNYAVQIARKILDYYLVGPQTLQPAPVKSDTKRAADINDNEDDADDN